MALAAILIAMMLGCQPVGDDHDALLNEYQRIADRAAALAQSSNPPDAAVAKQVAELAEKAAKLKHKMLMLPKQPTAEQRQRYDASWAKLQKALHIACPKCPKGG